MLFYDWLKIARAAGKDPKRVILALRALSGEIPINRYDKLYHFYCKDFSGSSYLIGHRKLLNSVYYYTPKEIADYVALASFRNYAVYSTSGDTTLDLLHSPIKQEIIIKNRLLSVENGLIRFKFEETTKEI